MVCRHAECRLNIAPAEFRSDLMPFARRGVKHSQIIVFFEGGFSAI